MQVIEFLKNIDWKTFGFGILSSSVLIALAIYIVEKWAGSKIEESVKREYQKLADAESADRALFKSFLEILPSEGSIRFIKEFDFGGAFRKAELDQLEKFAHYWDNPEHEFLDKEIEQARKQLLNTIKEFLTTIYLNTFVGDNVEVVSMSAELAEEKPKKFDEVRTKLHGLADKVVKEHESLIRLAKEKLKC